MKLIHLAAKRFEVMSADNLYLSHLFTNFAKILGNDYLVVVSSCNENQFAGINLVNLDLKKYGRGKILYFWLPFIYYFFWLPVFIFKNNFKSSEIVFFSSDANLLSILIFWKKIFGFKFKICSDWHMLYQNWKDSLVAEHSDYLVTTSQKLKKLLISKTKIKEEKVLVAYGGVNLNDYQGLNQGQARIDLKLPPDKKLIGYIGLFKTMGMEKGIKTMIAALPYLSSDIMMVFVGARPGQGAEYEDYAKGLGVESKCLFVDIQPAARIPSYEKAMDILVIPYPDQPHFREYGFPMKVYEYMASRRPIIYSKLELTEEVLSDCAFLFEPDNPKDLADKINYVKDNINTEEVKNKVELAYNKAKGFDWKYKSGGILDFLK